MKWLIQMLKEGITHLLLAIAMFLFMYYVFHWSADLSAKATALFFIGREIRDFEIELLPGVMNSAGFENWKGLRPAEPGTIGQLRHSLSGWAPVAFLAALISYFS